MDLADIQPGILTAPHGAEIPDGATGVDLFVRLAGSSPDDRRCQLHELLAMIDREPGGLTTTVALTAESLPRLGVSAGMRQLLPVEFISGARERAGLLRDPAVCAGFGFVEDPQVDLVLMRSHEGPAALPEISVAGVEVIASVPTSVGSDHREHFGFVDGISNPVLEGSGVPLTPGNGVRTDDGWRPLRAGEIVYGYPDESGQLPGPTMAHDLLRNGSFLVWRLIEQDVNGFNALAARLSADQATYPDPEGAKEALMGSTFARARADNAFDYTDALPAVNAQSHVRRAWPRATPRFADPRGPSLPFRDDIVETPKTYGGFHRMIRRSMLYGSTPDWQTLTATVFRCYQASIADQFEFVQRNWLNDGDQFGQGRRRDPIAGADTPEPGDQRQDHRKWGGAPEERLVSRITTPLATRYAFVPGRQALRRLIAGQFGT